MPLRPKVYIASSPGFGRGGGVERRGGASHCPAVGTMHWVLGAIFFCLRQVRCSLQAQEVSKVVGGWLGGWLDLVWFWLNVWLMVGWLIGWLADWLAAWLPGWLVG